MVFAEALKGRYIGCEAVTPFQGFNARRCLTQGVALGCHVSAFQAGNPNH
jgi:hypothetical protein